MRGLTVATMNALFMAGVKHGVATEAFCQALHQIDAQRRHLDRDAPNHRTSRPDEWDYWPNRPIHDDQTPATPE